jgi:ABC-type glutathione transport system ATPase component
VRDILTGLLGGYDDVLLNRTLENLSGGERQRVELARVLVDSPDIIILDEPSTGQDHQTTRVINSLMRRLAQDGTTVICVSHDMPLLADVVERVIVMRQTEVVADASPREVFANRELMLTTNLQAPQITEISLATVTKRGGPIAQTPQELADDIKSELESEYEGSHIVLFDGDQELKIWFTVGKGLTLSVKGASITLAPDNLVTIKTDNKVVIDCPNVELGSTSSAAISEYIIKGETFLNLFNLHTHAGAGTPPTPISGEVVLSRTTKSK